MKRLLFTSFFILLFNFVITAQVSDFNLGLKSASLNDFQAALEHFQKANNNNLSNKQLAQIHYNIGVCLYRLKQSDKAVKHFEQAVFLHRNYEKAFYALGMALSDLNDFERAEIAFQNSIKIANGRNGETWFDLAFVYIAQKKYDEAFLSFQKAIEFGSQATAASHNNLGVIYAFKGNFEAAEKELEKAKKLNYLEATNNLQILRKAIRLNDKVSLFIERL